MRRPPHTYYDRAGVLRHRRGRGRKVRSDRGVPRAHPHGCAHCAMVDAWRAQAEAERAWQGGWRNETFTPSRSFGEWLHIYYRDQRLTAALAA